MRRHKHRLSLLTVSGFHRRAEPHRRITSFSSKLVLSHYLHPKSRNEDTRWSFDCPQQELMLRLTSLDNRRNPFIVFFRTHVELHFCQQTKEVSSKADTSAMIRGRHAGTRRSWEMVVFACCDLSADNALDTFSSSTSSKSIITSSYQHQPVIPRFY